MRELLALGFDSAVEAETFGHRLVAMERSAVLRLRDAAEVMRDPSGQPHVYHPAGLVDGGALGGAFWGVFFALVFFVPGLGAVIAACLALVRERSASVLESEFAEQLADAIRPGQAGWVLLAEDIDEERFCEAVRGTEARVVRTSLAPGDEAALREAFSTKDCRLCATHAMATVGERGAREAA
jgi:uncharacterized membrane protein